MLKYKKFQLIVDLKSVKKIDFVKFYLQKIKIARELFVKEIENGEEVLIPMELS